MKKIHSELIKFIQQSKIFSGLDQTVCENLLSRLKIIQINQGEILFSQGEASDGLYILIEGHLIATLKTQENKQKIIGIIEKGETVGEMGALSRQPRSLTVLATSDSILFKLTHDELEAFFKQHPKLIFHIIDIIISRSQTTIKILSEKRMFKHIALIQGNPHAPIHIFINNLQKYISSKSNIVLITDPQLDLAKQITAAEEKDKILIFLLTPENKKSLGAKIDHIVGIYIIVDGDKRPHLSKFVLEMLKGDNAHFITQYELILMHENNIDLPINTIEWLKLANFTLHHHIRIEAPTGYQRLIRMIRGKSVGLVFGGGGGKAWTVIGALKAIKEFNIPIDAIGGTSAGAILAGTYALYDNIEETLINFYKHAETAKNPFNFFELTWPLISLWSSNRFSKNLIELFNQKKIEDLWITFFAISCNLNTGKEIIHRRGSLFEAVRSSSSIPGIIPPMVLNNQLHVDGGLLNNLPVDIMKSILGIESIIIAVSLTNIGEDSQRYNFPPILPFKVGLLRKLKLAYLDYKFPPYVSTFLNSLLMGSYSKEKFNKISADILINPDLKMFGAFNYEIKNANKLVDIGYQETKKALMENKNILDSIK